MTTIAAIFEGGVFKPQGPVTLSPGTRVEVILPADAADPVEIMRRRYPSSFGVMAEEDADEMGRIIGEEFGGVNPDEWR